MYELKRQFNSNARIADGKFQYLNYNFNAERNYRCLGYKCAVRSSH